LIRVFDEGVKSCGPQSITLAWHWPGALAAVTWCPVHR
jgi:hypothetical protein